jgi:hypothetical protein
LPNNLGANKSVRTNNGQTALGQTEVKYANYAISKYYAENMQRICREYVGNMLEICWKYAGNIQECTKT